MIRYKRERERERKIEIERKRERERERDWSGQFSPFDQGLQRGGVEEEEEEEEEEEDYCLVCVCNYRVFKTQITQFFIDQCLVFALCEFTNIVGSFNEYTLTLVTKNHRLP
jgi:hypothetical protein